MSIPASALGLVHAPESNSMTHKQTITEMKWNSDQFLSSIKKWSQDATWLSLLRKLPMRLAQWESKYLPLYAATGVDSCNGSNPYFLLYPDTVASGRKLLRKQGLSNYQINKSLGWLVYSIADENQYHGPWFVESHQYVRPTLLPTNYDTVETKRHIQEQETEQDQNLALLKQRRCKLKSNLCFIQAIQSSPNHDPTRDHVMVLDSISLTTSSMLNLVFSKTHIHVPNPDQEVFVKTHRKLKLPIHCTLSPLFASEWIRNSVHDFEPATVDFGLDYCCSWFGNEVCRPKEDVALLFHSGSLRRVLWITVSWIRLDPCEVEADVKATVTDLCVRYSRQCVIHKPIRYAHMLSFLFECAPTPTPPTH